MVLSLSEYQRRRGGRHGFPGDLKGPGACDGGLFMPTEIPALDVPVERSGRYDVPGDGLRGDEAVSDGFYGGRVKGLSQGPTTANLTRKRSPSGESRWGVFPELYHGSTIAFRGHGAFHSAASHDGGGKEKPGGQRDRDSEATSGDTGKAAMAGFADVPGTRIIVFYPKDGVSKVQELQMRTQKGANTSVVAIHGNFDDAQTGVKKLFGDKALEAKLAENGYQFSSANSINIGRLVPQIVYYVYAYAKTI